MRSLFSLPSQLSRHPLLSRTLCRSAPSLEKTMARHPRLLKWVAPAECQLMQRLVTALHPQNPPSAVAEISTCQVARQMGLALTRRAAFPGYSTSAWRHQVEIEGWSALRQDAQSSGNGVIIVTGTSMFQGGVQRLMEEEIREAAIHFLGLRDRATPRENLTNSTKPNPLASARSFILARRTLQQGGIVMAAGNSLNRNQGEWLDVTLLGRLVPLQAGWARLAETTGSPVWFALARFQEDKPGVTLVFKRANPSRSGGQKAWVEHFSQEWVETLRAFPAAARPLWLKHWSRLPLALTP